jgi:ribosomal protein S12 methylthiotransferase accessory factor
LAEALERHSATAFSEDQFIWATADELGVDAVDLDSFPVCSERELQNPACPLVRPTKTEKIRWVQGLSLNDGELVYLPLVSVYITHPVVKGERFLSPISTGCAAHESYDAALLSAILEVIERDALSIAWLQKLPLPQIDFEDAAAALGEIWDLYQQSFKAVQVFFFNATTDLGIPVVYGLRVSPCDPRLHTVVACSSSVDPAAACRKVMLELASCAAWMRRTGTIPDDIENFNQLYHGSSYMGRQEQAHAFDFLLNGCARISLDRLAATSPVSPDEGNRAVLAMVIRRLSKLGYSVYAADISTDEALRAGMRVVRAVIPGLMPFSWIQRARYLGHPRLYQAPQAMGYPVHNEYDLNPYPQPFG